MEATTRIADESRHQRVVRFDAGPRDDTCRLLLKESSLNMARCLSHLQLISTTSIRSKDGRTAMHDTN